jgi:hypothetical protein
MENKRQWFSLLISSIVGVLFGPHPELAWRLTIAEQLEKTIQAEIITAGDSLDPNNVVISLVPQQISNPKHNQTKLIALEVRVPAEQESKYIDILDRLNERTVDGKVRSRYRHGGNHRYFLPLLC